MPVESTEAWGPLAGLVGTWEGAEGMDVSYSNVQGTVVETPYHERATFNAFGPVENGVQVLFGLDYRMAAWRGGEENPFHTEVGYWLWDEANTQVMRCFMVPRGCTILAGGTATPRARLLALSAEVGSETYGILSNLFLAEAARTVRYDVQITIGDGSFEYHETTAIEHAKLAGVLAHTDRNALHRVEG